MYMELFTAVIGRLRDVSVNVRKVALRLFSQLVYTFAILFDVKVGEGEQFVDKETTLIEYEAAEKNYIRVKEAHDQSRSALHCQITRGAGQRSGSGMRGFE